MDELNIQEKNIDPTKQDFGDYLDKINLGFKEQEVQEKAKSLNIPYVLISEIAINPDLYYIIDKEDAEIGKLVAFYEYGKKLKIAVSDINREQTKNIIKKINDKGYITEIYLATEEGIKSAQKPYYSEKYLKKKKDRLNISEKDSSYEAEIENLGSLKTKILNTTAEKSLDLLHAGSLKTNASDIHLQPLSELSALVRFRIDGKLMDIFEIPYKVFDQITKRIKYLSHLKLNISNYPQDGKYSFEVNNRKIDVRVSTLPSSYGESLVMRILDPVKSLLNFEALGFEQKIVERLELNLNKPHGLVLVTGPTGSGKTTTLYSMLHYLNTSDKKIITLEDPIEYQLKGITQSQINLENNYNFDTGLKAILRQDPNIVMVGEIRDLSTAETASQAALTGHIVLSTLHTNSAIETIPRLVNMGVPSFMIAPSLNVIIAQRLVRKVCSCATEREPNDYEKQYLNTVIKNLTERGHKIPDINKIKSIAGCELCSNTGYKGQTSIIEILDINEDIKEMILNNEPSKNILKESYKNGFINMKESGVIKIVQGVTTFNEVWRVA